MAPNRRWGTSAFIAYVLAIASANWLTAHHGPIPVGLGLQATAGTYCAGITLMLRNALQECLGRRMVMYAIEAGAALTALTSPAQLAFASMASFLAAELLDTSIYTPVRRHGWIRAVLLASAVGAALDTVGFLYLAGYPVTGHAVAGQFMGKAWAVWVPTLGIALWRRWHRRACAT